MTLNIFIWFSDLYSLPEEDEYSVHVQIILMTWMKIVNAGPTLKGIYLYCTSYIPS